VQEPHDAPAPAITPWSPTAENNEIIRSVLLLLHLGHAIGLSASAMARRASKDVLHSEHLYSYSGIAATSPPVHSAVWPRLQVHCTAL